MVLRGSAAFRAKVNSTGDLLSLDALDADPAALDERGKEAHERAPAHKGAGGNAAGGGFGLLGLDE
jgi:hypothetical protein